MEISTNYAAIHGKGGKTTVGGKPMITNAKAFTQMAQRLHQRRSSTKNLLLLTSRNMQQRWDTYRGRFKTALNMSKHQTGAGLSNAELDKGMSFQEKLENKCPHFQRMKALYGKKANVKPAATVELGVYSNATPRRRDQVSEDGKSDDGLHDFDDTSFAYDGMQDGNGEDGDDARVIVTVTPTVSPLLLPFLSLDANYDNDDSLASRSVAPSTNSRAPRDAIASRKRQKSSNGHGKQRESAAEMLSVSRKGKAALTTANETRASLSSSYAKNSDAKLEYFHEKLIEEKRQWGLQQDVQKQDRDFDRVLRQQELDDRQAARQKELDDRTAARQQTVVLELIRQQKSPEKIAPFLRLLL